jgi:tetratricopeptide (TPR) repeat protein
VLGKFEREEGRLDLAKRWLERSATTRAIAALGLILEEEGDIDGALERFRDADRRGSAFAAYRLGYVLARRDGARAPEVEDAYSRADFRGLAGAAVELGLLATAIHFDGDEAERHYVRADRRGSARGAFNLACRVTGRDPERGRAAYERCIARGDREGHVGLARLLKGQGKLGPALSETEQAGPDSPLGRELAGDIHEERGDHRLAVQAFGEAAQLGNARAAYDAARLTDAAEAHRWLDRAWELVHDDTHARWIVVSDRARLIRLIEKRRSGLPKVGAARTSAEPEVNARR